MQPWHLFCITCMYPMAQPMNVRSHDMHFLVALAPTSTMDQRCIFSDIHISAGRTKLIDLLTGNCSESSKYCSILVVNAEHSNAFLYLDIARGPFQFRLFASFFGDSSCIFLAASGYNPTETNKAVSGRFGKLSLYALVKSMTLLPAGLGYQIHCGYTDQDTHTAKAKHLWMTILVGSGVEKVSQLKVCT